MQQRFNTGINYDGVPAMKNGVPRQYIGEALFCWVDGDDVAQALTRFSIIFRRLRGESRCG
ncbi:MULTISPECIES: hypothetical protein [Serratia]|uniref:hypothetical protein n=1 Tax=Serratia TaxID=613 RepID=UPI0007609EBB|nr:hypothetical protein [Serratia marcescens]MBH2543967.1 hypothetical protein [Serratia marcescens]MBH3210373.1 hypothetical protein [Serratia marcescens]MDP8600257.1 hypothetical protein [Serratia marcescens]MDP8620532.1 hypothetical protein [Serratia marcescens]MDP8684957.1 hypothetical protein [Serratia marcescens]